VGNQKARLGQASVAYKGQPMEHNGDYPGENSYNADFEGILERFRGLHLDMGNKENRSAKAKAGRDVLPKSPSLTSNDRPVPDQLQPTPPTKASKKPRRRPGKASHDEGSKSNANEMRTIDQAAAAMETNGTDHGSASMSYAEATVAPPPPAGKRKGKQDHSASVSPPACRTDGIFDSPAILSREENRTRL